MEKDINKIYERLKRILKKFEKPLEPKMDSEKGYDLWSVKELVIDGRKRSEIFFASIVIQSKYVGFYYMPIYTDTNLKEIFKPELLKTLKGKACFHIKNLDDELEKQIRYALETGYKLYKKRAWI
ncbi:MAG: DUF1801 domain-containing protein [Ignavibacteriae bacterium]|nr:DUF1801 domain-containing protein [Ignavibacteriota bacterium]